MKILRSPDDAVDGLPGYPTDRRWVEIPAGDGQTLRVHMVDTGPTDAPVVAMLHGNPSWSYLWRHQIGPVVEAGYRVIAPDLVGMGLSDKPADLDDYTVERHVEWMRALLVDALELSGATFVLHDWGGIIGMRLAAENPGLVSRMSISNTGLPFRDMDVPLPDVIEATGPYAEFQEMARVVPVWEPWTLLPMVMVSEPTAAVVHGYRAPYPDPDLTIGSRAFTQLLPTRPDNPMYPANAQAWRVLDEWTKPVVTIFSDKDLVAPHGWKPIVERIPGAVGQPHVILEGGGHFLQEDIPDAFNDALLGWLEVEPMTYTLYGAPVSLYTGKARAYLRRQGIDFVEISPGSDRYLTEIVPELGRWIIPVMETPDGELIQDGADIIDHFEKGPGRHLRTFAAYPDDPILLAIAHVFEVFGGEGMLRPAMHYRWNFDEENLDYLASEFALLSPPTDDEARAKERFLHGSGRMRGAARAFGVTVDSAGAIEVGFEEFLDLFSAHLADHPYLLGGQPTIGDFGLIAALWAHLYRDPKPTMLIKQRAPRVGRWVERMTTAEPYRHEYADHDGSLLDPRELPDTLLALMRYVAEEYLPELIAHVDAANEHLASHPGIETGTNGLADPGARGLKGGKGLEGRGVATFDWRGQQLTTGVMPYRFWLMQRLHDDLAAASAEDQARTREAFRAADLEPWLDLRTIRRVERVDNLEVWGPEEDH